MDYGWSSAWPESKLTVSGTAGRQIVPNARIRNNLSLLSDFMAKIPFNVSVNSGYRTPATNAAIGGSPTSQHVNGLAVDIQPPSWMPNSLLATWFYVHKSLFPEIDQVIWYTRKSHVHVGICPTGATDCVSGAPRGQFLMDDAGRTRSWVPSPADLAAEMMGVDPLNPKRWLTMFIISTSVSAVGLALIWRYRDRIREMLG